MEGSYNQSYSKYNTHGGIITSILLLIQTTLLHCWGTGALFWGTVLGHLGHSSGALGALVWGTWGTRLGHLRKFFEVLEVPTMQLRHLFAITHLLGKAEALQ